MNVPRPGDTFYLDVAFTDGTADRYPMIAGFLDDAYEETAEVLSRCGDRYLPPNRHNPHGRLYRADGTLVAEGGTDHFEELAWGGTR